MWHEARKQERKIRGMLVDYRKRAERRRDFYEKIKADPTQFLQVHGRQCKIHLDPAIAAAAEGSATMMPWQGHADNLIDRFDVRAHLDVIPTISSVLDENPTHEERNLNYERYRIIAQNAFLAINEERFLKQLHLEEQFGYTEHEPKKKKLTGGVAIGFNYDDGTGCSTYVQPTMDDGASDGASDSDLDVDLSINIAKIDQAQAHEMNRHGRAFGMSSNDFYSFLTNDIEEAESVKQAKEEEHEKALFSGRKSRRERRAHREKRMANRRISPPCYAARASPTMMTLADDKSPSRSTSPESRKITYITSFGDDDEDEAEATSSYAHKVKYGTKKTSTKRRASRDDRLMMEIRQIYVRRANSTKRRESRRRRSSRSRRWTTSHRYRTSSSSNSSNRSPSRRKRRAHRSRSSSRSRSSTSMTTSSSRSSRSSSESSESPVRKSRTKSPTVEEAPMVVEVEEVTPKVSFPRYYGRKKSDQKSSSSEIGDEEEENSKDTSSRQTQISCSNVAIGNSGTAIKAATSQAERLKRRRQALLAKQFNADKMEEQMKSEREKQEQQTREDEMREMALKSRKKYQGRRSAYDSDSSVSNSRSRSRSKSSSPKQQRSSRRHRENSRGRDRELLREKHRRTSRHREQQQREDACHRDERRRDAHRYRDAEYSDERAKTKALVDY